MAALFSKTIAEVSLRVSRGASGLLAGKVVVVRCAGPRALDLPVFAPVFFLAVFQLFSALFRGE